MNINGITLTFFVDSQTKCKTTILHHGGGARGHANKKNGIRRNK